MGASSSCKIFETLSTALQWVLMNKYKIPTVTHILDDFMFVGPPGSDLCLKYLNTFLEICKYTGIPVKHSKTVYPTSVGIAHGITFDTINMQARLPNDKLIKCKQSILYALNQNTMTIKQVQALIGLLSFVCKVVRPGRSFLRRLIDLTMGKNNKFHNVNLNKDTKLDLELWLQFLSKYNGVSLLIPNIWTKQDHLKLYTDASGKYGFGAVFDNEWVQGNWPETWREREITIKELYPIVLSTYLWADQLENKNVMFYTDNMSVVHIINTQTSRDKNIMILVRKLVLKLLQLNTTYKAEHISGKKNIIADALSRGLFQQAKEAAPHLDAMPKQVPHDCLPNSWIP